VRLLLDECVPRPLKRELAGHDVSTVVERGWSSKRNTELLRLMLAEGVAVVVVVAGTNRLKELRPLVPEILEALGGVKPGQVIRVGA
jgi:hypothetical protein